MSPAIPDRWLHYKPLGERIPGTRFIAFKVPLREDVVGSVEAHKRLVVDSLLREIPDLGLIIDLTNTNRYYDPEVVRSAGVLHKKLMIPGKQTPSHDLVEIFKRYVKTFIERNQNNDKLIGVHCTHGVNRTGYLICSYMISELAVSPYDAISKFAAARGHPIERRNYIAGLHKLNRERFTHYPRPPRNNSKYFYAPRSARDPNQGGALSWRANPFPSAGYQGRSLVNHTSSLVDRTRSSGNHIRFSENYTRIAANHTRSPANHTRSPANHTRSLANHTRSLANHTRSPSERFQSRYARNAR